MCDEIGHVVGDCPYWVIQATLISAVRGRDSTRGATGKKGGACGGGRGPPRKLVAVVSVMLYQLDLK